MEQPGCLHAAMDVYKWATKLGPLVPGDLLLDCFELAREIRRTDMQASPYDVSSYGLDAGRHRDARGQGRVRARGSATTPSGRTRCACGCSQRASVVGMSSLGRDSTVRPRSGPGVTQSRP